jgi:hypothetical protein
MERSMPRMRAKRLFPIAFPPDAPADALARAEVTNGSIATELGGREKRIRIQDIVSRQIA